MGTWVLSMWSASALFMIRKNGWHEDYMVYRKPWMPDWCDTCATLWLALPPALALGLFLSWPLLLAPLLVPPVCVTLYGSLWR